MDAREQAIVDTQKLIAALKRGEAPLNRQIDQAIINSRGWRIRGTVKELRSLQERRTELTAFLSFLENEYQEQVDALEYRDGVTTPLKLCSCGLVVFDDRTCAECGKPACVLHSYPYPNLPGEYMHVEGLCLSC